MNKNICIIAPLALPIPNVKGGAIETLITNLVENNEKSKKINITVISVYDKSTFKIAKKYKYTKFIYIKKGIVGNIINFIKRAFRKITKNKKIIPYYYKKIFKILQTNDMFDYIIAEGSEERCFKYLLEKTTYKKEQLIAHIHYHSLADVNLDEIFGKIITVSEFVKNEWLRTSKDKKEQDVKVLMNGIDLKKFDLELSSKKRNELRDKYGFKKDDFIVIYCGRIIKVKGVKELVQAIKKIKDNNIKLLIVGSPNFSIRKKSKYLRDFKKSISDCKERIKYTGYIDNSELYKYYKSADIMIVPSLWEEAAGLVCIEGMISKKPLIITKSGGMVEYATEDCAIQIERNDKLIDNIVTAILDLKTNRNKYKSIQEQGYERAKSFSSEKYYENFCKIIQEM